LPNPELLNSRPSILVFASADQSKLASEAGANIVGGEELVPALIEGTLPTFNRCLATTSMLPTVMKVARILGPKGLMPNVKTGTLVDGKEIGEAVRNCLQTVPFKIEKHAGLLNMPLGSVSKEEISFKYHILFLFYF
jgi:large subunit ribosomal protein L1